MAQLQNIKNEITKRIEALEEHILTTGTVTLHTQGKRYTFVDINAVIREFRKFRKEFEGLNWNG